MNLNDPKNYNREALSRLGIYELRELARSLGVVSPTSKDKKTISNEILQIIYGEDYQDLENLTKGRPAKRRKETEWLKYTNNAEEDEQDLSYEDLMQSIYPTLDRTIMSAQTFVAESEDEYKIDDRQYFTNDELGVIVCENYEYLLKSFDNPGAKLTKLDPAFVTKYNICGGDKLSYKTTADGLEIFKINGLPVEYNLYGEGGKFDLYHIHKHEINRVESKKLDDENLLYAKQFLEEDIVYFLDLGGINDVKSGEIKIKTAKFGNLDEKIKLFYDMILEIKIKANDKKEVLLVINNTLMFKNILDADSERDNKITKTIFDLLNDKEKLTIISID